MQIQCTAPTYLCTVNGKHPRWQCFIMSIFHSHDRFSKVESEALRLNDDWWLDTIRFFRNANEIYSRFDDWKSIDRFYFIPLKLNMIYSIGGHAINMADGTVYLGTFIKNTLEHPELFSFKCPKCGKTVYPYGYNGSPLSGRVDLQGTCACGWGGYEMVSGWRVRSEALKDSQKSDSLRRKRFSLLFGKSASVQELLTWLE